MDMRQDLYSSKVTKVVATYPDNWEDLTTFMVKG
jgi:hypothetical protein